MADFYAAQQVGVADGTVNPALRADGRQVGANETITVANKVTAQAWANGDRIFLGRVRAGQHLRRVVISASASLGTTTLSIGSRATAAKYTNAATLTTANQPTLLPFNVAQAIAGPLAADEDIWLTLGVGGIAAGVDVCIDLVIACNK